MLAYEPTGHDVFRDFCFLGRRIFSAISTLKVFHIRTILFAPKLVLYTSSRCEKKGHRDVYFMSFFFSPSNYFPFDKKFFNAFDETGCIFHCEMLQPNRIFITSVKEAV